MVIKSVDGMKRFFLFLQLWWPHLTESHVVDGNCKGYGTLLIPKSLNRFMNYCHIRILIPDILILTCFKNSQFCVISRGFKRLTTGGQRYIIHISYMVLNSSFQNHPGWNPAKPNQVMMCVNLAIINQL